MIRANLNVERAMALCRLAAFAVLLGSASPYLPSAAQAQAASGQSALMDRLVKAYPDHLTGHDGKMLIWRDGSRMAFDDGETGKSASALLERADIEDQFFYRYPAGRAGLPPPKDFDPGRVRNDAFFVKMYGDCDIGQGIGGSPAYRRNFGSVNWLPRKWGKKIQVTAVNGIARRLQAVSDELDALPDKFLPYLKSAQGIGGIFACRVIQRTNRRSMHAYAAAIDIVVDPKGYHLNSKPIDGLYKDPTSVPWEIVEIFEKHGFIWGGKWHHFDSFHFEYRPELLPDSEPMKSAAR